MTADFGNDETARTGRGAACPDEIRRILDRQDWTDLLPRLLKFSLYLIRVRRGAVAAGHVSAGKMAEDYVMDAVMKVYQGRRRWDPGTCPDLLQFLIGVLRSTIGHEARKMEHRSLVFWDHPEEASGPAMMQVSDSPEEQETMMSGFLNFLGQEADLIAFARCAADGLKPREIAQRMNRSSAEIYNIRKVVKRRLAEFLSKRSAAAGGGI